MKKQNLQKQDQKMVIGAIIFGIGVIIGALLTSLSIARSFGSGLTLPVTQLIEEN